MLDKIIKYALYLSAFLLPLFFLPQTLSSIPASKQILLAAFCFSIFILWLIKIISSGKLSFVWNKICFAVLLLLSVLGISTALSASKIQSFWGMNFEPDTFFSFILYGLVFFLFANLIKEKERKSVLISFLAGAGILSLLFLFQVVNPIGTAQALAVFLGGAFLILIAITSNRQISSITIKGKTIPKKVFQFLAVLLGAILFTAIFLVSYWVVWLGIVFGITIIIFRMLKHISANKPSSEETSKTVEQGNLLKPLFLPLCILVLAITFIFLKVPTGNLIDIPAEVSPTYQATLDISTNTLEQDTKNMIFGSGLSTFGYQYNLYQSGGLNPTNFWQLRFNQGIAVLPTLLTTSGIAGILAVLLLLFAFFWQGFKFLRIDEARPQQLAVFVGASYFLISWFLYPSNLSLMFAAFLMLGLFASSASKAKEFLFTQSIQKSFIIMLLGVFLIAGSVFGFYTVSQKYAGAIFFTQGLNLINNEDPKIDEGIAKIYQAIEIEPKAVYFRNLSQVFLFKIQATLNNQELSQEEKQKEFQEQVSNLEMTANAAVQANPQNSQNWLQLANIYKELFSLQVEGSGELAVLNYQKAGELDPQNPQIPLSIGWIYKLTADRTEDQELKNQNFELALAEFQKSIALKNNFSATYYLIAQIYEAQEKNDKAIENYKIVLYIEPDNAEIQKKIEELSKPIEEIIEPIEE